MKIETRNSEANVFLVTLGNFQVLQDAYQAEATACIQALRIASEAGMVRVIMGEDAQNLERVKCYPNAYRAFICKSF